MNHTPAQNEPAARITLDELRALIRSDPPIGAEVSEACQYDVQTLAQQCRCSLRHLERIFRALGRRPHRWLREHRLVHELQMLAHLQSEGKLESLKRVAIEWEYRDPDHFRRAFKAAFKMPPRAFLIEHEKALKQMGIQLSNHNGD